MGVTKQYLRYVAGPMFGVLCSLKSNIVYLDIQGTRGKFCAVGACENVIIWDIRRAAKHMTLLGDKHEVTKIAKSPDGRHLAVGYNDGNIKVFSLETGEAEIVFSGHKSSVMALNYDKDGVCLVSGAKDTAVIVWDIVNESGLYRLKGHKGQITQARFMKTQNILVTCSKDTFVKFWDLETQHCFKTLIGHKTELWDFVLTSDDTRLITGSSDSELRVWNIAFTDKTKDEVTEPKAKRSRIEKDESDVDDDDDDDDDDEESDILTCTKIGTLLRHGKERVVCLNLDSTGTVMACHGTDSLLEVYHISTKEEIKKHLQRRQKKARKRLRETGEDVEIPNSESLADIIRKVGSVKASGKLRAFDLLVDKAGETKMVSLLNNNMIEILSVTTNEKKSEGKSVSKLAFPGHRSDVRTLSFSSDHTAVLSASGETVKIWNRATQSCIISMACDYALCSLFAPGDRHVIIGTKSGKLQIYDIAAGILQETVDAHTGAVWSISMAPDKRGIVSGGADKEVKFWNFELVADELKASKRLTVEHTRTLKMSDDVLCVKYSPDQRLLAVSLLDNTVKVFFADTLKFFLSLYGHKLPVLCMDISADSTLLVTGSADRNVKIWGLDFGDCHKSIFAHDDSIMCIQFVSKTHLFFTGGKDGKLKEWDADKFEHIMTLEGHHAEIWCLAVSGNGKYVVTGSHDKSMRVWEKSFEPLVLEEEREMEREKQYEEDNKDHGDESVVPGETNTEVGMAGKKTLDTVKAAERLMEAIELYREETFKLEQHKEECRLTGKDLPPPPLHPMFMAYSVTEPIKFVLQIIKRIKSSELEESLLVLPFSYVTDLLKILETFTENKWEPELSCRCLLFLLKVHRGQIVTNQVLLPTIDKLRSSVSNTVENIRDTIGFNQAGLQFLKKQIEEKEEVTFFADATGRFKEKKKRQKKKVILAVKT